MGQVSLDVQNEVAQLALSDADGPLSVHDTATATKAVQELRLKPSPRLLTLVVDGLSFAPSIPLDESAEWAGSYDHRRRAPVDLVRALLALRLPVICAARGRLSGVGVDVLLACDFRFGSACELVPADHASGGDIAGTYLLPAYVGLGRATEILLLGSTIEVPEAVSLGLLTGALPTAGVDELKDRLKSGPTATLGTIRSSRNLGLNADLIRGLEAVVTGEVECMLYQDAREGARAFASRRRPEFTGELISMTGLFESGQLPTPDDTPTRFPQKG